MKIITGIISILLVQIFATDIVAQNVGIGTTTPQSKLAVGTNSEFRVDASGNILRINNVPVSFPSTQGANGQVLTNNGAGNLSWAYPAVKNSIILAQAADTASLKLQGFSILKQHESQIDTLVDSLTEVLSGNWQFNLNPNTTLPEGALSSNEIASAGSKLYTLGLDSFMYEYNTATNIYTQLPNKAPLNARLLSSITMVGSNEVYVYGGYYNMGTLETPDMQVFNNGAFYNITTHVWTPMTAGPQKMAYHASVALGTNIYLFGGIDSVGQFFYLNRPTPIFKYNTITKIWSNEAPPNSDSYILVQGSIAASNSIIYMAPFGKDSIYEFQTGSGSIVPLVKYTATSTVGNSYITYNNSNASLYKMDKYFDTLDVDPNKMKNRFYKINPATGLTTNLNRCGIDANESSRTALAYNSTSGKVYFINSAVNAFTDVGTTSVCKIFFNAAHPWYYLKKN